MVTTFGGSPFSGDRLTLPSDHQPPLVFASDHQPPMVFAEGDLVEPKVVAIPEVVTNH
jgi:hypothetical protein